MKLNYKKLEIDIYGDLSEMAANYKYNGRYWRECFLHPIDDCWHERPMIEMKTESWVEQDKVEVYDLIQMTLDGKGNIVDRIAFEELKKRLDNLSPLFSGETYNGWDYEELAENMQLPTAADAVIDTALFVVMKCFVYQRHQKLLTIS